jgi:squalene synthase HpnC
MTASGQLRSGKGSGDENFPVASWLIKPQHRPAILAFYEFVRVADDIADHADLASDEKIARLDRLEASLLGKNDEEPEGVALRAILNERGLSPRHAQDLLSAFRQDATKLRYTDWDDLIDYCSRSAMPVGRYVLDVHGEARSTWPASDALCAALQIINHVQDCAKDYRALDRVYIPLDALKASGASVEDLAGKQASPALLQCLRGVVARTATLLDQAQGFSPGINDTRLGLEVAVIHALAKRLIGILTVRDPLSEVVHLSKSEAAMTAAGASSRALLRRLLRTVTPAHGYQTP